MYRLAVTSFMMFAVGNSALPPLHGFAKTFSDHLARR